MSKKKGTRTKKKILITIAVLAALCVVAVATYCDHQWLDATCSQPSTCQLCGRTDGEPLGHRWLSATCTLGQKCRLCGEIQGEPRGHHWMSATCMNPQTCKICGETQGEKLAHTWVEATCAAPETCSYCGQTQGEPLPHNWSPATCAAPETCAVCGATQGETLEHNWKNATCLAPQTCDSCGITQGGLGDHSWRGATCLSPKNCAVCGQTEGGIGDHGWKAATCTAPITCAHCGETQGEALGHNWNAATCDTPQTCARCGATSGYALGHSFVEASDGSSRTCSVCGKVVTIKYVAITFDDGPSGSITRNLLSGLADRNARATFFLCGYRIASYPGLPATIASYGHEIGLHTENHEYLSQLDAGGIRRELQSVLDRLEGIPVTTMRPPGGYFNDTVKQICAEMNLSIIMWSVDPQDWATNDVSTIVSRIVNNTRAGSIILMHDLKSSSVQAALRAIDILQAQGYEFVTVSQLARIYGKSLNPGQVYYSLG